MRALGDKISSMIVAQTANVPTIDWSGAGLVCEDQPIDENGHPSLITSIPDDIYSRACVRTAAEGLDVANRIGFPVMIKASEGGGGKGIRKVEKAESFAHFFGHVQREVPGSPIFIMKLASEARHLEVQLLGDQHGNITALYGRDCSIQRRHQKIIEEAPVSVAAPDICLQMEIAAIRLGQLVGYENAGTVEYLYDPVTNEYSFLELNPRLQVEHPCSEMITGINIPAAQLQIAMGIPLWLIKDVRSFYGEDPAGIDPIDFTISSLRNRLKPKGHVVACRITSENPDSGFKPGSGRVLDVGFKAGPGVWGYFSVSNCGSLIHEWADSQFGHVFSYATTRESSIKSMISALKEFRLRANFGTTIQYLIALLETPEFSGNAFSTAHLDRLIAEKVQIVPNIDWDTAIICGAAVIGRVKIQEREEQCLQLISKRQLPSQGLLSLEHDILLVFENVQYNVKCLMTAAEKFLLTLNGTSVNVNTVILSDGGFLVRYEGHSHTVYLWTEPTCWRLMIDGRKCILDRDHDPTIIRSSSPGRLTRLLVNDGDRVAPGTAIAELEVMKMYMPLVAEQSGIITFTKNANVSIEAGEVVALLQLSDTSTIPKVRLFDGGFALKIYDHPRNPPNRVYQETIGKVNDALAGYHLDVSVDQLVSQFISVTNDKTLPFLQLEEQLAMHAGRLPNLLEAVLLGMIQQAQKDQALGCTTLLRDALKIFQSSVLVGDHPAATHAIQMTLELHQDGPSAFALRAFVSIMDKFLEIERFFEGALTEDDSLEQLRLAKMQPSDIVKALQSHQHLDNKIQLILKLFEKFFNQNHNAVSDPLVEAALRKIAKLSATSYGRVARKARELLLYSQVPSLEQLQKRMEAKLMTAVNYTSPAKHTSFIQEMVQGFTTHLDALPMLFHHEDYRIGLLSMEIYIRRIYETYVILSDHPTINEKRQPTWIWTFTLPNLTSIALDRAAVSSPAPSAFQENMNDCGLADGVIEIEERAGLMTTSNSLEDWPAVITDVVKGLESFGKARQVVYIAIPEDAHLNDTEVIRKAESFISPMSRILSSAGIRRLTLVWVRQASAAPGYFTFREMLGFREDCLARHIEPAMAYLLEFNRITCNYDAKFKYADPSGQIHIYQATERVNPDQPQSTSRNKGRKSSPAPYARLFIRLLIRPNQALKSFVDMTHFAPEAHRILEEVLDAVETVLGDCICNSLYINILPVFYNRPEDVQSVFVAMMDRYKTRFMQLRINQAEIRMNLAPRKGVAVQRYRFLLTNPTGYTNNVESYLDVKDPLSELWTLRALNPPASRDGIRSNLEYPLLDSLENRRNRVHAMGSAYIYDFPAIFEFALRQLWDGVCSQRWRMTGSYNDTIVPEVLLEQHELVLNYSGPEEHLCIDGIAVPSFGLKMIQRDPGLNSDCGMVGWLFKLKTPEESEGRLVIVVGNDLTFEIGSFGVQEDRLFDAASKLARHLGIPRIFVSANSGARMGLAEEVKSKFKVAWRDPDNPLLGFDYLYVTPHDYASLPKGSVLVREEKHLEETRMVITDIIGCEDGLGVENLSGSGLIAGETARAYREIFTISLVSGRSVGIGAYLLRLGQRVIQKAEHPIILTGVAALNKVLGREVYRNNLQIGGPQIMHSNGVVHRVVQDDLEGVREILAWLSFVPKDSKARPAPVLLTGDDPHRKIAYFPPKDGSPYDPRLLLTGRVDDGCQIWEGGLIDRDSFIEYLPGWAKTVVVGRARLGGIPLGVICVETRTVEKTIPADPADAATQAQILLQAGQVWFPDSAFKTAQFIRDCNNGEQLPLLILANWRGFSGGQRDLYEEILKFGAEIVDALGEYRQPVFVYLPPGAELRGGSWVVVDSQVNPRRIEMYADPSAHGGIVEPEALIAIKYRLPQVLAMMRNLDSELSKGPNAERERILTPIYNQVACHFAECHDRAGRMKAKGVIREIVPWANARSFFYDRLRLRLEEDFWCSRISSGSLGSSETLTLLYDWIKDCIQSDLQYLSDREIFKLLEENTKHLELKLAEYRRLHEISSIKRAIFFMSQGNSKERERLLAELQNFA